jgi:hypothetical protein
MLEQDAHASSDRVVVNGKKRLMRCRCVRMSRIDGKCQGYACFETPVALLAVRLWMKNVKEGAKERKQLKFEKRINAEKGLKLNSRLGCRVQCR